MDVSAVKRSNAMRAASTLVDLQRARAELGGVLPADLEALYAQTDGFLMPNGVGVYSAEDIAERNATFETEEFCHGFVLIGDNSGGKGYLIDATGHDRSVFSSDLGDLSIRGFAKEAASLEEWIAKL